MGREEREAVRSVMKKKAASTSATQAEVAGGQVDPKIPKIPATEIQLPEAMVQPSETTSDSSLKVVVPEIAPPAQNTEEKKKEKEKKKKKNSADPQSESETDRSRKRIKITKTHKEK